MPYTEKPAGAPTKNLNKGYGMESNSTEKKDLMKDNPIARDASGSRSMGSSWMSKHSKSKMGGGSPLMEKKELKGGQVKLDKNGNGVLDGEDFKMM